MDTYITTIIMPNHKSLVIIILCSMLLFLVGSSCSKNGEEPKPIAELLTTEVAEITATSAVSGGTITSDGGSSVTARGVCWSIEPSPTIEDSKSNDGSGGGTFSSAITNLSPNTIYYVRAYATTSNGTAYGITYSFTTQDGVIVLSTESVSNIKETTAKSGGEITSDGGSPVSSRGICWSSISGPTVADSKTADGTGTGIYLSDLTGLDAGNTYYVRAYATNAIGTYYGDEIEFKTIGGPITDADGNSYTSVIIGSQVWLVENLITTKYANGDPIANVTGDTEWGNLSTGAWCSYNNDPAYDNPYGKLYNWYAVNDERKLCPTGWHVPSDEEWIILINYLGGYDVAGGKMKEDGTEHWNEPNTGADNSSSFTGVGAGYRDPLFQMPGVLGYYWSSTDKNVDGGVLRLVFNESTAGIYSYSKNLGLVVRCLGD